MNATVKTFSDRLALLGFSSYAEYLRSELWANIRTRVYGVKGRLCVRCKVHRATQIHHAAYDLATLSGSSIVKLVPICRDCHKQEHGLAEAPRPDEPGKMPGVIVIPWNGGKYAGPRPKLRNKPGAKRKKKHKKKNKGWHSPLHNPYAETKPTPTLKEQQRAKLKAQ